jgi:hypothetical protein
MKTNESSLFLGFPSADILKKQNLYICVALVQNYTLCHRVHKGSIHFFW